MSRVNEDSEEIYEGQYFKAFINDKKMLEIHTVSNDNFIVEMSLIDNGSWVGMYVDRMKEELDEILETFVDSASKYSLTDMFDQNFHEKLEKLKIR